MKINARFPRIETTVDIFRIRESGSIVEINLDPEKKKWRNQERERDGEGGRNLE